MNRGRPVEASVQIGEVETPYLRAGTGPAMILLDRAGPADGSDPLFVVLSRRGRVVCPRLPDEGSTARWLLALVDGLGLERPVVVLKGGWEAWDTQTLASLRACEDALGPVFLTGSDEGEVDALAALLLERAE